MRTHVVHTFTPEMDEEIRRVYRERVRMGPQYSPVKELAEKWGMKYQHVSYRAAKIGAVPIQYHRRRWSDEEMVILEHHAHKTPDTIQHHLRKRGYKRSRGAIAAMLERAQLLKNLKGQSGYALADCFGVSPKTVTNWIRRGLLKAKKRGTRRGDAQGGDSWFVTDRQIRDFVKQHLEIIDFRKVDKWWLVDLLLDVDGPGPFSDISEYVVEDEGIDHHGYPFHDDFEAMEMFDMRM